MATDMSSQGGHGSEDGAAPRAAPRDSSLLLGQLIFVLLAEFVVLLLATFLLGTNRVPPWAPATVIVASLVVSLPFVIVLAVRLNRATKGKLRQSAIDLTLDFEDEKRHPVHAERYEAVRGALDLTHAEKGVVWSAAGRLGGDGDGTDGRGVVLFQHLYIQPAGNTQIPIYTAVAATRCPEDWPILSLGPEHLGHRIAELFGSHDLQLEEAAFNQRWRVKCDDEDFAIALLTPEVQRWLLDAPRSEQWAIGRGWVRVARRERVKPDLLDELARRPGTLLAQLPPELR